MTSKEILENLIEKKVRLFICREDGFCFQKYGILKSVDEALISIKDSKDGKIKFFNYVDQNGDVIKSVEEV